MTPFKKILHMILMRCKFVSYSTLTSFISITAIYYIQVLMLLCLRICIRKIMKKFVLHTSKDHFLSCKLYFNFLICLLALLSKQSSTDILGFKLYMFSPCERSIISTTSQKRSEKSKHSFFFLY